MKFWEEIHGFRTLDEYDVFECQIENLLQSGKISEVPADPDYGYGEIYGGRWFLNLENKQKWRLVPPDFPFRGLWELVRENYVVD